VGESLPAAESATGQGFVHAASAAVSVVFDDLYSVTLTGRG
jgi:hypothetical protein